jgi:arginase family enzyme
MNLYHDPHWPRAGAWLAGDCLPNAIGRLVVLGAPAAKGSVTPGRCDLAPAAIRNALQRYSTYDFSRSRDVRALGVRDAGDLDVAGRKPEESHQPVRDAVARELETADALVLLGGDNSITYPGCQALPRCGLLTLDAHLDMRHLDGGLTNGNPVAALLRDGLPGDHVFQIGIQSFANSADYARDAAQAGNHIVTGDCVRERGIEQVLRDAFDYLDPRVQQIYVDLDVDVLDRMYSPATPGARPGGLRPWEIRRAAYLCGAHSKVRVMDLVEIDPTQDIADVTTLAAAACLLEFASGLLERLSRA